MKSTTWIFSLAFIVAVVFQGCGDNQDDDPSAAADTSSSIDAKQGTDDAGAAEKDTKTEPQKDTKTEPEPDTKKDDPPESCTPGEVCDDENPCTKDDVCTDDKKCEGKTFECPDGPACVTGVCKPEAGGCVLVAAKDGDQCDDENKCTEDTTCKGGVCGGKTVDCNDNNPCTADMCVPAEGCTHTPVALSCDDKDKCTTDDQCKDGKCVGGNPKCTTTDSCVVATCNSEDGSCGTKPANDGDKCDDGNQCTAESTCKEGTCVGKANPCDDGKPCTKDTCDKDKGCTYETLDGQTCDDDNPCTEGDVCNQDKCEATKNKCDDGEPCTEDTCDQNTGECSTAQKEGKCDNGNQCTTNDVCKEGKCEAGDATDCNDNNKCTKDSCDPQKGCINLADSSCGACDPQKQGECNDNNPCTDDVCDANLGCVYKPKNGQTCDDGNACTENDKCQQTVCTGQKKTCNDNKPCTTDECNPAKGCEFKNNTNVCGDLCTPGQCTNGKCVLGKATDCDDKSVCTSDSCDPKKGCVYTPKEGSCDADQSLCTVGDKCQNGVCIKGKATECKADDNQCTLDACNPKTGQCENSTKAMDGKFCNLDTDACTFETCAGGKCKVNDFATCPGEDPCKDPYCDPQEGCKFYASKAPCDDGSKCTTGDSCLNFKCVPGKEVVCDDGDACTEDSCNAKSWCSFKVTDESCSSDPKQWTILIYMAADNNLEPAAITDMNEMIAAKYGKSVNLVVQIDRTPSESIEPIGSLKNFENTKRIGIANGKATEIGDLGELNTGDPNNLSDFIKWGFSTYKSEKKALILWNHGNAWSGYGGDDTSKHDRLTFAELVKGVTDGLQAAQIDKLDLLGFDACLMADYAVINAFHKRTHYMVVSADFEPSNGWDYTKLSLFNEHPSATTEEIARKFVQGFYQQSRKRKKHSSVTLSLLDTNKFEAFKTEFEKTLGVLTNALEKSGRKLGRARAQAQEYGRSPKPDVAYHMVDIGDLVKRVALNESALLEQKDNFLTALDPLVLDMVKGKLTSHLTGMSIYFPMHKERYSKAYDDIAGMEKWRAFLTKYYESAAKDAGAPQFTSNGQKDDDIKKSGNQQCGNELCETAKGETPTNCEIDCKNAKAYDVKSCDSNKQPQSCSGSYLVECKNNKPELTWCGDNKSCGESLNPGDADKGKYLCGTPQSTAQMTCQDDGEMTLTVPIAKDSSSSAAQQNLFYGYMNKNNQKIQLYGQAPAKLDEQKHEVRGHWNQRVLTVKQGAFTAPVFAKTTYEGKLAHHEVPIRFTPAEAQPCKPGQCKTLRAIWHVTTDTILNTTESHSLYVDSDSGLSELTLQKDDRLEPLVLTGVLAGEFTWKPQKPLVLDISKTLSFKFDTLSNVVEFDAFGQPKALGDGTVQSLDKVLGYTRAYLELTAKNTAGKGTRAYWLGNINQCPPGNPNYCLGEGDIPDCSGDCHPAALLHNGVCDDGENESANFNCFKYKFDSCKPPPCPPTDHDIELYETDHLDFAYKRDCNMRCVSRVLLAQQVDGIKIIGNKTCDDGNAWPFYNFNCAAWDFDFGDCKCGPNCFGHGTCGKKGCTCDKGWTGKFCETPPSCGDGVCEYTDVENCETCEKDCKKCPVQCGDGTCHAGAGENCVTCDADCGKCQCGDGHCDFPEFEDCESCPKDCGACPKCGDSVCEKYTVEKPWPPEKYQETCHSCPEDCGVCHGCCCEANLSAGCNIEPIQNCVCKVRKECCLRPWSKDCVAEAARSCGVCKAQGEIKCGDGICSLKDQPGGEDCKSCEADCGKCNTKIPPDYDWDDVPYDKTLKVCTGTGLTACSDNCRWTFNPGQLDMDKDGIGDACDADIDGDNIEQGFGNDPCVGDETPDKDFCDDNCPQVANADQKDTDADGIGDACESSYCGDEWCDASENNDNCPSDCCAADDCCLPGSASGCLSPEIQSCVCDKDPSCCTYKWHTGCVALASTECQQCKNKGDCCKTNGTPGCNNPDLATLVCVTNPECCSNLWGHECVKALMKVGKCNTDCCTVKPTPECNQPSVTECVCAMDPFCCNNQWDSICVSKAITQCNATCSGETKCGNEICESGESCASCRADCGVCSGNCCEANGTPGCTDSLIQACVCDANNKSECCEKEWTAICAIKAKAACGSCACGDGICTQKESCVTCAEDCGKCSGSCTSITSTPGCSDPVIQNCVCHSRFSCCGKSWDGLCVEEAKKCGQGLNTCKDRCKKNAYDPKASCQCDPHCKAVGDCCDDACDECSLGLKDFCEPNTGPWVNVTQSVAKTPYGRTVAVAHNELAGVGEHVVLLPLGDDPPPVVGPQAKHDLGTVIAEIQKSISKGSDIVTIPVHTSPDDVVMVGLDTEILAYGPNGEVNVVNTGNLVENATLKQVLSHSVLKDSTAMVALQLADQADTMFQENPDPMQPQDNGIYQAKWGTAVLKEATELGYGTKQRPLILIGNTQGKKMLDAIHSELKTDAFKDVKEHVWTALDHEPEEDKDSPADIVKNLDNIKSEGTKFVILDRTVKNLFSYLMYAKKIKLNTGVRWDDNPKVVAALREEVDVFFSTYSPDRTRRRIHENNAIAYFNVFDTLPGEDLQVKLGDYNNNQGMDLQGVPSVNDGGDGQASYPQIVTPDSNQVMGNWLKFDGDQILPLYGAQPGKNEGFLVSAVVWFPQFKDNPNTMDGHYTIASINPSFEMALYKSDDEMHGVQLGVTLNQASAHVNLHDFDASQYTPFMASGSYNGSTTIKISYAWSDDGFTTDVTENWSVEESAHFTVGARLVKIDNNGNEIATATNKMKGYIQRLTILYWNPK